MFVVYIYFSKYGNIRLGNDDSRPEYNDLTWSVRHYGVVFIQHRRFTMLFSCGLSTGLFFYGVSEPIYHYTGELTVSHHRSHATVSTKSLKDSCGEFVNCEFLN